MPAFIVLGTKGDLWTKKALHSRAGIDYNKYPHLKKWVAKIYERPAAKKALTIPTAGMNRFLESEEEYGKALKSAADKIQAAEQNDSAK